MIKSWKSGNARCPYRYTFTFDIKNERPWEIPNKTATKLLFCSAAAALLDGGHIVRTTIHQGRTRKLWSRFSSRKAQQAPNSLKPEKFMTPDLKRIQSLFHRTKSASIHLVLIAKLCLKTRWIDAICVQGKRLCIRCKSEVINCWNQNTGNFQHSSRSFKCARVSNSAPPFFTYSRTYKNAGTL